jgi:hypothetical protein
MEDTVIVALSEVLQRLERLRALAELGAMADRGDFDEFLGAKGSPGKVTEVSKSLLPTLRGDIKLSTQLAPEYSPSSSLSRAFAHVSADR